MSSKKRNVYKVAISYNSLDTSSGSCYSISNIGGTRMDDEGFYPAADTGFPIVLIMAWAQGLKKSSGTYNSADQITVEQAGEPDIQS